MTDPRPVRPELPSADPALRPTGLSPSETRLLAESRALVRSTRGAPDAPTSVPARAVGVLVGAAMAAVGGWLLLGHMQVRSGFGVLFGRSVAGPALVGMLVGLALVASGRRVALGWLLTLGGLVTVVLSVLWNLRVWFLPTPLTTVLVMFVLLGGGLGLVARSLSPPGR
jgi:hypothetical protein